MGPTKSVVIWLLWLVSSSSNVRMSSLLCVWAHCTYGSMLAFSHVSPAAMVPSCMSSCRLGTTKETVGSVEKADGKSENGRLSVPGMPWAEAPCQFTQGLCLATYSPELITVEPTAGNPSE